MSKTRNGKLLWLLLVPLWVTSCTAVPKPSPSPAATSTELALPPELQPQPAPAQSKLDPLQSAEAHLKQTKLRLSQVSKDPQFNGYQDLAKLGHQKDGLLALAELRRDKGKAAFEQELSKWIDKKSSPLLDDIKKLKLALGKPMVSAIWQIPESGPIKIDGKGGFERTVRALTVLPFIYDQLPDREEQLEGHLFALSVGRKISLDATTVEHYLMGLEIEAEALKHLRSMLSSELGLEGTRRIVTRLQMELGSPQETELVLDSSYLATLKQLEQKSFEPQRLRAEQMGLAARYLKLKSLLSQVQPPPTSLSVLDIPELKNSPWVAEQADQLDLLHRSRRLATQRAALELLAALESHKLEQKAYPSKLQELVPAYLTRIPADGLSQGGEFHYEASRNACQLSSEDVGADKKAIVW